MTTTAENAVRGFLDHFESHHEPDWDLLGIFADACADADLEDLERAARWMVRERKWPHACGENERRAWYFWDESMDWTGDDEWSKIPVHLDRRFCPSTYSFEEILERLGTGLKELGMV